MNFRYLDPQFPQLVKFFNIAYLLIIMAPTNAYYCIGEKHICLHVHATIMFDFRIHVIIALHSYFCLKKMYQSKASKLRESSNTFHNLPEILVCEWAIFYICCPVGSFFPHRCLHDAAAEVDDCNLTVWSNTW